MYFLVDSKTQTVTAYKKLGDAVRTALATLNVTLKQDSDPVKIFNELKSERFAALNLASAFESISESDDKAAQELAKQFQQAVDSFYAK